jgi:hypothetical protein
MGSFPGTCEAKDQWVLNACSSGQAHESAMMWKYLAIKIAKCDNHRSALTKLGIETDKDWSRSKNGKECGDFIWVRSKTISKLRKG